MIDAIFTFTVGPSRQKVKVALAGAKAFKVIICGYHNQVLLEPKVQEEIWTEKLGKVQ